MTLELLKDDKEYYLGVGRNYLSNSDIGALLQNPLAFRKPSPDNKSFAEGRYFHQLLLEPEKAEQTPFVDVSTRTTKEYKIFCEENNFEYVLLWKEMKEIQKLASVMKSNIIFYDLIYKPGNKFEVPMIGEIHGEMWKGKADIESDDSLYDLKTTSDINKFKWNARSYNYDSQCYIYYKLFNKMMSFIVIDKVTGQLGIFHPSAQFIESGEAKVKRAVEVYRKYFGPSADDSVVNHFILDTL